MRFRWSSGAGSGTQRGPAATRSGRGPGSSAAVRASQPRSPSAASLSRPSGPRARPGPRAPRRPSHRGLRPRPRGLRPRPRRGSRRRPPPRRPHRRRPPRHRRPPPPRGSSRRLRSSPVTTTTTPQHVVNQPNLNALSPHIEALRGERRPVPVQLAASRRRASAPGVPSFLTLAWRAVHLRRQQPRGAPARHERRLQARARTSPTPIRASRGTSAAADAAKMQSLGFNVVRLGIEWQALEPGSGGPNQPGDLHARRAGEPTRIQPGGGRPVPRATWLRP